ncbi:MAG: response regulator [Candidatus Methylumidiphilus sp.]
MTQKPLDEFDVPPSPADTETAQATAADYLETLELLAEQAGRDNRQGLQDACLLLAEALGEGLPPSADDAPALLARWPLLCEAYRLQPAWASAEIIRLLRDPGLGLALADEEFAGLEAMLLEDAGLPVPGQPETHQTQTHEAHETHEATAPPAAFDYAATLEALADQAGQDGQQGLQDACLLLAETLGEWVAGGAAPDAEAMALLDAWPALCAAYRQDPQAATGEIIRVLRHPSLNLPLADEEFGLIETMLLDGSGEQVAAQTLSPTVADTGLAATLSIPAEETQARLQALPAKVRELVELLLMQADMVGASLQAVDDPGAAQEALEETREQLQRFANAAETVGFSGLAKMCEGVDANLRQFIAAPPDAVQLGLLRAWLDAVNAYLPDFADSGLSQNLLASVCDPRWPQPLSAEAGVELLAQLRGVDASAWGREEAPREQAATADEVSLALPDDVNRELLDILLQELPGHIQQLSEAVLRLRAAGSMQDIELAQRIAHTLKGSANTVGIKGVAVLTHQLEDILLACAKARKLPAPALLDTLIDAADCLEGMGEALLGMGPPPADAQAVLQAVLDWANRIDREGLPEPDEASQSSTSAEPGEAEEAPAAEADTPAQATLVRVSSELVENLFRLSGESIILNSQAQERLRRVKAQINAMQAQFELLRELGAELDTLIDLRDLSGRGRGGIAPDFDALEMDQYNELHTASRRMVEAAVDAREMSADAWKELVYMDEVLEYQQSLAVDTQDAVMRTKLSPVAAIAPRLHRSLRQTCRLTGKQAELSLGGGRLLVDGDTLNSLLDPLMHVLRNAVDHGIESDADRAVLGKPGAGRISIDFESDGNDLLAHCRDDGRGLDFGAIRAAAEKRGLLQAGQAASKEDLQRLILRPNFSTRSQSTHTSGRGVGLDAVNAQVAALGGSLALRSEEGQGLTVEMRVPLPVSRAHGLLAAVGKHRVVIGNKGLSQVFYSSQGELLDTEDGQKLLLDGQLYPAVMLGDLLHIAGQRRERRPHGAILLAQSEGQTTAVLVDVITDSRDVVIKSLGHYLAKIPGIAGATILGDGTVTPVINIPDLLRAPPLPTSQDVAATQPEADAPDRGIPTVLVVDDSLSNRRALEQLLTDAGFQVRTAHDGVDAAELLAQAKPAIVLTDLEMPRMNGIELAAHIRAQPDGKTLPIIMITSRTTLRHRKLAQDAGIDFYLTKPVREDDLLDKIQDLLPRAENWQEAGDAQHGNASINA